jgi:dihydrofolate reductase
MSDFAGHVFIGVSVDGYIAKPGGDLDWLTKRGLAFETTGYDDFIASVDGLIVGRHTYETVLEMEEWPYTKPVFVLSTSLDPASVARDEVQVHRDIESVVAAFTQAGFSDAYVDGGVTIQAFLRAGLIDTLILSHAPVLIGGGAPLFGELAKDVDLELVETKPLGAGFVQTKYRVAASS